jgi:hypothetical protein
MAMLDLLPHRGLAPLFKRWVKHSPESIALYETDPNAAIATFLAVLRASAGPLACRCRRTSFPLPFQTGVTQTDARAPRHRPAAARRARRENAALHLPAAAAAPPGASVARGVPRRRAWLRRRRPTVCRAVPTATFPRINPRRENTHGRSDQSRRTIPGAFTCEHIGLRREALRKTVLRAASLITYCMACGTRADRCRALRIDRQ